jgi:HD-like signal output (HDOD) protein
VTLPAPPTSLEIEQLAQLVGRAETQLADVARLVEASAALSAVVLEAANSAELGLLRPVVRVPHAVALLGLRRLQSLAFSLAERFSTTSRP